MTQIVICLCSHECCLTYADQFTLLIHLGVINFLQRFYTFDVDYFQLQLFERHESNIPVNGIKRVGLSQSIRIFADATTRTSLFPDEYFVVWNFWAPFPVNKNSLKYVAKVTEMSGLFSADGSNCKSITFTSIGRVSSGVRIDLWIYGSQATSSTVVANVYYWLRHYKYLVNLESFKLSLIVHFPLHVDQDDVRSHLAAKLGSPLDTSAFDCDEAICVVKEMPTAKL